MRKVYRWKTLYSENEIRNIIITKAKIYSFSSSMSSNTLLYKNKGNKIYLIKSGIGGCGRGTKFFRIDIEGIGDSSRITGIFVEMKSYLIAMSIFVGIAWLDFIWSCLLNSNFTVGGKITNATVAIIWTLFCYKGVSIVADIIFFRKQQKEVIDFIEKELIK